MGIFTTIEASRPDYAPSGAPVDMDSWSCEHWKQYHINLKDQFGIEQARSLVMSDYGEIGWWADVHFCKYNCDWAKYMEAEGYSASNILSDAYCGVKSATEGVKDVGGTLGNVGAFTETITNTGFLIGLGTVVGLGAAYNQWYAE